MKKLFVALCLLVCGCSTSNPIGALSWEDGPPKRGGYYFYWESDRLWADLVGVQESSHGTGTIHTLEFHSYLNYVGKRIWNYDELSEFYKRGGKWAGPFWAPEVPKTNKK